MKYSLLPILFLLVCPKLSAKENISLSNAYFKNETSNLDATRQVAMPGLSPMSYGGSDRRTNFYWDLDLGYGHGKIKTDSNKITGGNIMVRFELGAKIEVGNGSSNRTKAISVSAAVSGFSMKVKSKPLSFTTISLPLSYSVYGYSIGGEAGFYWQLGTYLSYIQKVTYNDRPVTGSYNSFYFEPFASVGLHQPFRLLRRHQEVGHGRVFYGPFFSYSPTNLSKGPGVTTNIYSVGFRWTYVFM